MPTYIQNEILTQTRNDKTPDKLKVNTLRHNRKRAKCQGFEWPADINMIKLPRATLHELDVQLLSVFFRYHLIYNPNGGGVGGVRVRFRVNPAKEHIIENMPHAARR